MSIIIIIKLDTVFSDNKDGILLAGSSDYEKCYRCLSKLASQKEPTVKGFYINIDGSGFYSSSFSFKSLFSFQPTTVLHGYARSITIVFNSPNNGSPDGNYRLLTIMAHSSFGKDLHWFLRKYSL